MPRPGTMFHIVSYDIPSSSAGDRRRARVARYLEGLGIRVQQSVFELDIAPHAIEAVASGLRERLDETEDNARIYVMCGTCAGKVLRLGKAAPVEHGGLLLW